jgi:hypothetical protein
VDAQLLMSGFYAPEAQLSPGPKASFGDDAALYSQRAPVTLVRPISLPVLLAVTELAPGSIAQQTFVLALATTAANDSIPQLQ